MNPDEQPRMIQGKRMFDECDITVMFMVKCHNCDYSIALRTQIVAAQAADEHELHHTGHDALVEIYDERAEQE